MFISLFFFACVWAWGVKQSYFRVATENQGGKKCFKASGGCVEGGGNFKQDLMELGAGLFKTGEKILCIDNSLYEP